MNTRLREKLAELADAHELAVEIVKAIVIDIMKGHVLGWKWIALRPETQAELVSEWQRITAETIRRCIREQGK